MAVLTKSPVPSQSPSPSPRRPRAVLTESPLPPQPSPTFPDRAHVIPLDGEFDPEEFDPRGLPIYDYECQDYKVQDFTNVEYYQAAETPAPPPTYERFEIPAPPSSNSNNILRKPVSSGGPKVWEIKGTSVTLSALGAAVLVENRILDYGDLQIYKEPKKFNEDGPTDPISGALSAVMDTVGTIVLRTADYPILISETLNPNETTRGGKVMDFARDGSKGVSGIVGASLKAPMAITHNMARGFHNLPKLYDDKTVRKLEPITGTASGLKAAGKGFGFGLYDGITGLVTQPWKGATENGLVGGLAGFGKGIGGAICKPAAGAIGIPGSAFKGMYEQVQKTRGYRSEKFITAYQIAQGLDELEAASPLEKDHVLRITVLELERFKRSLKGDEYR